MASWADGIYTVHQKVSLDIDLSGRRISGSTKIYIAPLVPLSELNELRFNCKQLTVTKVSVNGKRPATAVSDTYGELRTSKCATIFQHHFLEKKLKRALGSESQDPQKELVITLTKGTKLTHTSLYTPFQDEGIDANLDVVASDDIASLTSSASVVVEIEFLVKNGRDIREGLAFIGCEQDDLRYPHVYTTGSPYPRATSCIFPTIDSIFERWTWEISITIPRTLGDLYRGKNRSTKSAEPGADNAEKPSDEDDIEMTAVCSGDFVAEVDVPDQPTKKTLNFRHTTHVSPQSIMFAVGPFQKISLSDYRNEEEDDKMGTNAVEVIAYCLPKREAEARNTCLFMPKAVDHFVLDIALFPFSKTFKVCFVDDLPEDTISGASLCVCSNRLLFPFDIIDPIYPVTYKLANALVEQWLGVSIVPQTWNDLWLIIGLARYKLGIFIRKLFGNNEYRFRLKKDAEKVCELDIDRPSLYDHGIQLPIESSDLEFIRLKAPVVISILERRLAKSSGSLVLDRVIGKIINNAKAGDMPSVETEAFKKLCEKYAHMKLEQFFQQWVYGFGYPRFEVGQRFNKKKMIVEMNIRQVQMNETPKRKVSADSFIADAWQAERGMTDTTTLPLFTGPMTIRIHEADGTPYEHVVEIRELQQKLEIPYNTKYKRLKRSRRQKERAAAAAGMDADATNEDVLLYCLGDVLQTEDDIMMWELEEWTKEEEDRMASESFEWIRLDSDFEWICTMVINQPDYMFLSQLQQDRDVVAQYESVQYFARARETSMISTILVRTLMDQRYYYGIRIAAAHALAKCATRELNWIGKRHLVRAFREFFCVGESLVPQSNDFSNFMQYHVQKAIVEGVASIKDERGSCPLDIVQFLLDLLKYNDNSNNSFIDCFYVATLIEALGTSLLSNEYGTGGILDTEEEDARRLREEAMEEIDRYQRLDQWLPCYQNVISKAALNAKRRLVNAGVLSKNARELLGYTREGTLDSLRVTAFEALVDPTVFSNAALTRYIFNVVKSDPSRYIRHNLLHIISRAIGAVAIGAKITETARPDPSDEFTFEIFDPDDNITARQDTIARETIEGAIAHLKSELLENKHVQQALWSAVQSRKLNLLDVRLLLQIARIIYPTKDSLMVTLRAPRRMMCRHEGKGKVVFYRGFQPFPNPQPPKAAPPTLPPPPPPPKPLKVVGTPTVEKESSNKPSEEKPKKFMIKLKLPLTPKPPGSTPVSTPATARAPTPSTGGRATPQSGLGPPIARAGTPGSSSGVGAGSPGASAGKKRKANGIPGGGGIKLKVKKKKREDWEVESASGGGGSGKD